MPTTGTLQVLANVGETLTAPENRSGTIFDILSQSYTYANGNGAGLNNLVWSDRRQLANGETITIDLNGGGLVDAFGVAVNFTSVTGIVIFNRETVPGTRVLRFGPAPAFTFLWLFTVAGDRISIPPSCPYMQWNDAGISCVGGLDTLTLINTDVGNTLTYDILIIGRS